jgi:DNA-binding NtrC family response regulator
VLREGERAEGRELEFIVRSLVELKLQVEELRRRVEDERVRFSATEVVPPAALAPPGGGVETQASSVSGGFITIQLGTTMAEIEKKAIEAALRETRGNRRKAAELLEIGERTLYRKLKAFHIPLDSGNSDN